MNIVIHAHKLGLSTDTTDVLVDRLESALDEHETHLKRVEAFLADVNGPKGGLDKQIRLIVTLRAGSPVIIEDLDAEWEVVFSRAAERAGQAVGRHLPRSKKGGTSFSGD